MMPFSAAALLIATFAQSPQARPPVIDMHLHASTAAENGPPPLAVGTSPVDLPTRDPWSDGVIEHAIDTIETAPFLTPLQKRDILYNNAARFLRLSDAEIARHHGR